MKRRAALSLLGLFLCAAHPLAAGAAPRASASPRITVSSSLFPGKTDLGQLLTDKNPGTYWHIAMNDVRLRHWLVADYGPGGAVVDRIDALPRADAPEGFWNVARLVASNNGFVWTPLADIPRSRPPVTGEWTTWSVTNDTPYRFYKIEILSGWTLHRDFFAVAELHFHRIPSPGATGAPSPRAEPNPVRARAASLSDVGLLLTVLGAVTAGLGALTLYRRAASVAGAVRGAILALTTSGLLWLVCALVVAALPVTSLVYALPAATGVGLLSGLVETRYGDRHRALRGLTGTLMVAAMVAVLAGGFLAEHVHFYYYGGDVREVYLPFRWLTVEHLRQGELLLWNPYVGTAGPNVVWGHVPIDVFTLADLIAWPGRIRYEAYLLVGLLLLIGAMYAAFRALGFGRLESLVPALSYPAMPFVAHYFLQVFTLHSMITLPLFLLVALRSTPFAIRPAILLTGIAALSFFGTKAEFWLFQVVAFLYIYLGCRLGAPGGLAPVRGRLTSTVRALAEVTLILVAAILLNGWHISVTIDAFYNSARATGFGSLRNLLGWPLYREVLLSFVESEYWRSVALIGLYYALARIASALPTAPSELIRRLQPGLAYVLAALVTITASAAAGLRFEYLAGFARSGASWAVVAVVLAYTLVAFAAGRGRTGERERWTNGDLCRVAAMALLPVFHLFKISNPSEAVEIQRFGVAGASVLICLTTIGLLHWRRERFALFGWGGVLLVLLMREHLQGFLIQGLGMVWHPKRDAYVLFFFLLIPAASGVRFFFATVSSAAAGLGETVGRWSRAVGLGALGIGAVGLLYSQLLDCRCQLGYGPHYADMATAFSRAIALELERQNGGPAPEPYRVAALPSSADYRRDLWTGEFPLNPHVLVEGRLADARLYNSTPGRYHSEFSNYLRYGDRFDPDYPIINHTFPHQILRFYPERFRGGAAVAGRALAVGEALPLGGYALLRNELTTLHPNVLGVLNVRFLITMEPLTPSAFDYLQHTLPQDYEAMRPVGEVRSYSPKTKRIEAIHVYENTRSLPRAFVVHDYVCGGNVRDVVNRLLDRRFDAGRTATVTCAAGLEPARSPAAPAREATIREYRPDRVVVTTRAEQPGLLVLTDAVYPGWTAAIDGQTTPIRRVDHVFKGVLVPAGPHEVVFRFQPLAVRIGRLLAAATFLTLLVLWARSGRPRRSLRRLPSP